MFLRVRFVLVLALLLLAGCAGSRIDENDPAAMYQDAQEDIENDHYQVAIEKLRTIKNKFPYSKFSAEAQLRLGDVYFMQESYLEAAAAYETFRDLHPKHERSPYAMFRTALSYMNDAPENPARDLTSAQKSVDAFEELIKRFPNDPLTQEGKAHLTTVLGRLAEKEKYVGDFYFKNKMWDSAIGRYEGLMERFPQSSAALNAKSKLEEARTRSTQEKAKTKNDG